MLVEFSCKKLESFFRLKGCNSGVKYNGKIEDRNGKQAIMKDYKYIINL